MNLVESNTLDLFETFAGTNDWILSPRITQHQVTFVQIGHQLTLHVINDFKMAKDVFALGNLEKKLYEN